MGGRGVAGTPIRGRSRVKAQRRVTLALFWGVFLCVVVDEMTKLFRESPERGLITFFPSGQYCSTIEYVHSDLETPSLIPGIRRAAVYTLIKDGRSR